jgi:hypothetical protein
LRNGERRQPRVAAGVCRLERKRSDYTRQFLLNSSKLKHPQAGETPWMIVEALRSREAVV